MSWIRIGNHGINLDQVASYEQTKSASGELIVVVKFGSHSLTLRNESATAFLAAMDVDGTS